MLTITLTDESIYVGGSQARISWRRPVLSRFSIHFYSIRKVRWLGDERYALEAWDPENVVRSLQKTSTRAVLASGSIELRLENCYGDWIPDKPRSLANNHGIARLRLSVTPPAVVHREYLHPMADWVLYVPPTDSALINELTYQQWVTDGVMPEFLADLFITGSSEQCSICYEPVERGSTIGCGHVYHTICIVKLLKYTNRCPMCRTLICEQKPLVPQSYPVVPI